MKKSFYCFLFAIALHSSWSLATDHQVAPDDATRTPATGTKPQTEREIATVLAADSSERQNSTGPAASSAEERVDGANNEPDNGGHVDGRAVDSGERGGKEAGDEDDGPQVPDGSRVAELYEDLEDSVVFEDSEAGGPDGETPAVAGGGRLLNEQHAHTENGESPLVPVTAAVDESAAVSTEEYDASAGTEEDAAIAGSSPVIVQRFVKYPEYVGSSSYRRNLFGSNVTRPEDLFRFWDPYEWTATSRVSNECADHMEQYQVALRNGKMWAFKSK